MNGCGKRLLYQTQTRDGQKKTRADCTGKDEWLVVGGENIDFSEFFRLSLNYGYEVVLLNVFDINVKHCTKR